ncbi:MAG: acyltransferase [Sphingobacteriia bacterium]|nr:MAG: acyltransferase [Sphingobacteriia bacterium]
MGLKERIKSNPQLKKRVHWLIIPPGEARPRTWVKWLVNPFVHHKGKGAKIRWRTRIDVVPFNAFSLGASSVIEDFTTINNGVGPVLIGENSLIGMGNVLIGPISVGNNVIFAQNIVASALNHGYENPDLPIHLQAVKTAPIVIEDDCWIAANAVITAGVTIGKHSVVGAGAVVTKSIPPYSVAVGNPAKIIKQYNSVSQKWEANSGL